MNGVMPPVILNLKRFEVGDEKKRENIIICQSTFSPLLTPTTLTQDTPEVIFNLKME